MVMKTLIKKILREQTSNTVLVVFGGINYATPEWMTEQIPNNIKDSRTIIVKSWDTDVQDVIEELNEITYSSLEVVGFSKGGLNVFELAKRTNIDFVGLIDPSVPEDWSLDGFPTNSILFFNNDNWSSYPDIKERQKDLASNMKEKFGDESVKKTELNHKAIPNKFFENYMKQ
tara:strand:- start:342 stop:860 length:519 start_codon:yes stop_codon:yes gene_type:complete